MHGILVEVWVARTVPINVLPCLHGIEMKFSRGNANDGPVFVMEEFVFEC